MTIFELAIYTSSRIFMFYYLLDRLLLTLILRIITVFGFGCTRGNVLAKANCRRENNFVWNLEHDIKFQNGILEVECFLKDG